MAKKRSRITNPEPFLPEDDGGDSVSVKEKNKNKKQRNKPSKHQRRRHENDGDGDQEEEDVLPPQMKAKVLKEALIQQKELDEDGKVEPKFKNPNNLPIFVEKKEDKNDSDSGDDYDDFDGFSETQSQFGNYEGEIDKEEERLLESFFSKSDRPQRTLGDLILEKIKDRAQVPSGTQDLPKFDDTIKDMYKGIGKILSNYTSGKLPLAFKKLPRRQYWEELLYLTEPEKWSANAVFQATRIFSSNLNKRDAERFYKYVLLPRIREDIRKNKRLHFALYQALKKSLYKPAAFNKGILFPLCESGTCNLREAVIISSIIQKISIPNLHSSVALLKLAEMDYCGTTSYFMKVLIEKKYALPYRVLDAMVAHFMRFLDDSRLMPVIWHQTLLAFVQRYKNELTKDDKDALISLVEKQRHKLVTPEILRELNNSRNRGEKEDDLMSISSPSMVITKIIEEDRFDIPDVPMEED